MPPATAVAAMKRTGRWMVALSWACRAIAAVILLQTLFFKFTAAPESVYIFTKVGEFVHGYAQFLPVEMVQASARIGSGVMELIAFLRSEFGVVVADEDITESNLGSLADIARYVATHRNGNGAKPGTNGAGD